MDVTSQATASGTLFVKSLVDAYSISGVKVATNVPMSEIKIILESGVYIINGRKGLKR